MTSLKIGDHVDHGAFGRGRVVYSDASSAGVRFFSGELRSFRTPEARAALIEIPAEKRRSVEEEEFFPFLATTEFIISIREKTKLYAVCRAEAVSKLLDDHLTKTGRELARSEVFIRNSGWRRAYFLQLRIPRTSPELRYPGKLMENDHHGYSLSHNRYCWHLIVSYGFEIRRHEVKP